jgi:hypothetical protein
MTTLRRAILALVAGAIVLVGCSSPDGSPARSGAPVRIADDVFGLSSDGESSNEVILLTGDVGPATAEEALVAAGERFMLVDETGVEHGSRAEAAAALEHGLYTPNYVSDPLRTDAGIELYVDCKGWIPEPMRLTFRRILAEELTSAGMTDVTVVASAG